MASEIYTVRSSATFLVARIPFSFLVFLFLLVASLGGTSAHAETIRWASSGSGEWSVAANWNPPRVPTADDDVVIENPGGATVITISVADVSVRSIQCAAGLRVYQRSLTLTKSSSFSGSFELASALLTVRNAGTVVAVVGAANLSRGRLSVEDGAVLNFPALTSYAVRPFDVVPNSRPLVSVSGTGSRLNFAGVESLEVDFPGTGLTTNFTVSDGGVLDFSALKSLQNVSVQSDISFNVQSNGQILLPNLTELKFAGGFYRFNVRGSLLSLPALELPSRASFIVGPGGVINSPGVTSLDQSTVLIEASEANVAGGTLRAPLLTSITNSKVSLGRNAMFDTGNLINIHNTSFALSGGVVFDKIAAKSWTVGEYVWELPTVFISASGAGTRLVLSSVESLTVNGYSPVVIEAKDNGTIDLSGLKQLQNASAITSFEESLDGRILLPALEAIKSTGGSSKFSLSNSSFGMPALKVFERGRITIGSGGTLNVPNLTALTDCEVVLSGNAVFNTGELNNIDGSQFTLSDGAKFSKVSAKSYRIASPSYSNQAVNVIFLTGSGTVLNLSSVQRVRLDRGGSSYQEVIEAADGAVLNLSGVTLIESSNSINSSRRFEQSNGGEILLPRVETINLLSGWLEFNVGDLEYSLPVLRSAQKLDLAIGPGGQLHAPQLTVLRSSRVTLVGSANLDSGFLSDITGTTFDLSAGAIFDKITATTYELGDNTYDLSLPVFVSGSGSKLNLSSVKLFSIGASFFNSFSRPMVLLAADGGVIDLAGVANIANVSSHATPLIFRAGNRGEILFTPTPAVSGAAPTIFELGENGDNAGPIVSGANFGNSTTRPLQDDIVITNYGYFRVNAEDTSGISRVTFSLSSAEGGNENLIATFNANSQGGLYPTKFWNPLSVVDGTYLFIIRAYDELQNLTEKKYRIIVDNPAPPAPKITAPINNLITGIEQVEVKGTAASGAKVLIYNNNALVAGPLSLSFVSGDFTYTAQIPLSSGANVIQAAAVGPGGISERSAAVNVTLDNSIPKAPFGVTAQALSAGEVRLAWNINDEGRSLSYNLYRASTPFSNPAQAVRINNGPLTNRTYFDLPTSDGNYYYRVEAVNLAGTKGPLSEMVTAISDRTPPKATISFQSNGPMSDGVYGVGLVEVTLISSEELLAAPFLSVTPSGGVPIAVALSKLSPTNYVGTFAIKETTPSGTMYAVFSAYDKLNNRGTEIENGKSLVIDTTGPEIASLQVSPNSPIQSTSASPAKLTVAMVLSEAPQQGSTPVLQYRLSGKGTTTFATAPLQIGADPLHWQMSFTLASDAGYPEAENLSFKFSALDKFGNLGSKINGNNTFQIYHGTIPPLTVPFGLSAKPMPQGKVELSWKAVPEAAGYQLYRRGPNAPPSQALIEHGTLQTGIQYLDTTPADGLYSYSVASIRNVAGTNILSSQSAPVDAIADSIAPIAPSGLALTISGAGVKAVWNAPPGENAANLTYSLYRANLPPNQAINITGLSPVKTGIRGLQILDSDPSQSDHAYAVTAVDNAGNQSPPSNTFYLNFGLLPVANLQISKTHDSPPHISWIHKSATIAGYALHFEAPAGSVKLYEGTSTSFIDSNFPGGSRVYSVTAYDEHGVTGISRKLLLPEVEVDLPDGVTVSRGIFNKLEFSVRNRSAETLEHFRLHVQAGNRSHLSDEVALTAGETRIVPVVIGGYSELSTGSAITSTAQSRPNEGESVDISRQHSISVDNGAFEISLEADQMRLGSTGKVRFKMKNTSAVTTEIVVARANGTQASDEVRLRLSDLSDNVYSVKALKLVSGEGVVTVVDGRSVIRVEPNSTYISPWIDLDIPSATPPQASLVLEIDKFHYRVASPLHAEVKGHGARREVYLEDLPYSGEILSVTPANSFGDREITIRGRAREKAGDSSPFRPLDLVIRVQNFERIYQITSDAEGKFEYRFRPGSGEYGTYDVSLLYPGSFERPVHAQFTINSLGLSPQSVTLHLARNYEDHVDLTLLAHTTSAVENVRLELLAVDQPLGVLPKGIRLVFPEAVTVQPGEQRVLSVKVSADATADFNGIMRLRLVSTASGAAPVALVTIAYSVSEAVASPRFSLPALRIGVRSKAVATGTVELTNAGFAPLINAQFSLINATNENAAPAWVYLVTKPQSDRIEVGATQSITIAAQPTDSTQLGHHLLRLKLAADGIAPVFLPVDVAVSADGLGGVIVHVSDIYTASLDKHGVPIPGLGGARVKLQNEDLPEFVFQGVSDQNGEVRFNNVPAGSYLLRGSASDHNDNTKRILIQPGHTTSEEIFLLNGLVTIEWSVTEVSIEDRYEIRLEADFETDVPAPVLVMEPVSTQLPALKKGEVFYGELRLTNYGLIKASGLESQFPTSDDRARYEFLGSLPSEIGPKESITIPYRITALTDFSPAADGAATGGGSCLYDVAACIRAVSECLNGEVITVAACAHWLFSRSCSGDVIVYGSAGQGSGLPSATGGVPIVPQGSDLPDMPKCVPGINCDESAGSPLK